ncbi:unnamed protein product [Diplocarpon coronariae]
MRHSTRSRLGIVPREFRSVSCALLVGLDTGLYRNLQRQLAKILWREIRVNDCGAGSSLSGVPVPEPPDSRVPAIVGRKHSYQPRPRSPRFYRHGVRACVTRARPNGISQHRSSRSAAPPQTRRPCRLGSASTARRARGSSPPRPPDPGPLSGD